MVQWRCGDGCLFGVYLEIMSARGGRDALDSPVPSDIPRDHVEAEGAHAGEDAKEKEDKRTLKLTRTFTWLAIFNEV